MDFGGVAFGPGLGSQATESKVVQNLGCRQGLNHVGEGIGDVKFLPLPLVPNDAVDREGIEEFIAENTADYAAKILPGSPNHGMPLQDLGLLLLVGWGTLHDGIGEVGVAGGGVGGNVVENLGC